MGKEKKENGIADSFFLPRIAVAVGLISLIIGIATGFATYTFMLWNAERSYQMLLFRIAKDLVRFPKDIQAQSASDEHILNEILAEWRNAGRLIPSDEYICIVDGSSRMVYHDMHPESKGRYEGGNKLENEADGNTLTIAELVRSGEEIVGRYTPPNGDEQIAAFVHIPHKGWLLGLHRSREAMLQEVKKDFTTPYFIFVSMSVILIPASIAILFWAFRQSNIRLRVSEAKYRFLADNMGDIAFIVDLNMHTTYISTSIEKLLGFTPEERMKHSPAEMLTPESLRKAAEMLAGELEREKAGDADPDRIFVVELEYYHKNGSVRILENVVRGVRDRDGKLAGIYGIGRDITEKKQAEEWLKSSLEEKETLLKEIHHRVKNNMQIISSILELQKHHLPSKEDQWLFDESQKRIRAMALVHEKLYQSGNFSHINIKEYIAGLMDEYSGAMLGSKRIRFNLAVEDIFMSIQNAIPCALIINELVTNAMKHAFTGRDGGDISIEFDASDVSDYRLTVKDDGIGLPGGFEGENAHTLGLQIVHALVRQLEGSIEISSGSGTRVSITFPA